MEAEAAGEVKRGRCNDGCGYGGGGRSGMRGSSCDDYGRDGHTETMMGRGVCALILLLI